MPVYCVGERVHHAFERLENLTMRDWELLIVDDGSDDDTWVHVSAYAAGRDHVKTIRLPENVGPGPARNAALRIAAGRYVWFVDWDDEWNPGLLSRLITVIEGNHAEIAICRATWRNARGVDWGFVEEFTECAVLPGWKVFDMMLDGGVRGYLWNKLFRRSILPVDMFPRITTQEDFCAIAPIIAQASTVAITNEVLYHHVTRPGSLTNAQNPPLENMDAAREIVLTTARTLEQHGPDARRLLLYDYETWYLSRLHTALRLGNSEMQSIETARVRMLTNTSEIAKLATLAPSVAVKALLAKYVSWAYPFIYRLGSRRIRNE